MIAIGQAMISIVSGPGKLKAVRWECLAGYISSLMMEAAEATWPSVVKWVLLSVSTVAYCDLADLDGAAYDQTGLWSRGLLIRRSLADGERAYFTTWCPAGTPIQTLVGVEGRRWSIEDAFETAKTKLGLAHNETRSQHGWHRHVSLVMMAFALLAVIRHHANAPPPKRPARTRPRTH